MKEQKNFSLESIEVAVAWEPTALHNPIMIIV